MIPESNLPVTTLLPKYYHLSMPWWEQHSVDVQISSVILHLVFYLSAIEPVSWGENVGGKETQQWKKWVKARKKIVLS